MASNTLIITIPSVNVPEVKYVFHCLMKEFLGLEYELVISREICDFSISYNSQSLRIANVFFRDDDVDNLYTSYNIPTNIYCGVIDLNNSKKPQVSIFGDCSLAKNEEGIYWGNDIVAATFYMLTRWEEAVVQSKDRHSRFVAKDSLAYKNNFLHRPIVNEFVEIIYQVLKSFGMAQNRKFRQYRTIATHDVDRPYLWSSTWGKMKSVAASLLVRRSSEELMSRLHCWSSGKDPFDSFDQLMDMAEEIGEKAHFFFMSGGDSKFDNYYQLDENVVTDIVNSIKRRKHFIGIHPSYNSYQSQEMLMTEIDTLRESIDQEVISSRQHYLRFDVSSTWNNLDACNIVWDSTLCYADVAGFRSGVCYTYPVFDLKSRTQLELLEKPLIVMDTTLLAYEELEAKAAISRVEGLQEEVKRYEGDFVFLWHNSSFNSMEWLGYDEVFKCMYKQY